MYSLLCLSSLLSIYFFVKVWKEGKRVHWMAFSICTALSLYAHNLAFLILFTLDLFVLLRRRWKLLKPLFIAHIAIGLLFLPWLLLVPSQFAKVQQAYWIPKPGPSELVRTLIVFTFNLPVPDWLLSFSLFFSLLLLFLTLYRAFRPSVKERNDWAKYLTTSLSFIPVMTMFFVSQIRAVYIERGVLVCALAYYLTIAYAFLKGKFPRFVVLDSHGFDPVLGNLPGQIPDHPLLFGEKVVHETLLLLFKNPGLSVLPGPPSVRHPSCESPSPAR